MQFKVRDKRRKERFFIDDEYLNGAAKIVGIFGTGVYIALCRYANEEQSCFPSQERMAEQLGVSLASIKRGLKSLEKHNIITKKRIGKGKNNEYWLLDHREWKTGKVIAPTEPSGEVSQTPHPAPTDPIRLPNKEPIKGNVATEVATVYPSLLDELLESKKRVLQVIGIWIKAKGLELPNKTIRESIVKRNLRSAKLLEGYDNGDIIETIQVLKNTDYLKKWTLETVSKYIDEVVAQKMKQGLKIVKFEEVIKSNGLKVMRAIYEKD